MGSTEIRSQKSCVLHAGGILVSNTGLVDASDDGSTAALSEFLVEVGGAGEPEAVWITSIYADATVAGQLYFFEQDTVPTAGWTALVAGNADHVYTLHIPVGGAGITGVSIGPITEDLCVAALGGAYVNTRLGEIAITYDYV